MKPILFPDSLRRMLAPAVLVLVLFAPKAKATPTTWEVTLGAQSNDASRQAMAFLPNELWIYQGDSITWTSKSGENHTVTFLDQTTTGASAVLPGPIQTTRPANGTSGATGCAGDTQGGASPFQATGASLVVTAGITNCVSSGPLCDPTLQQAPEPSKCYGWTTGTTNTVEKAYTVTFPNPGNFRLVCLVHADMTGTVHVLSTLPLPHDPSFYADEAADQARALISDTDHPGHDNDDRGDASRHVVVTPGELVATGGGKQYLAIMRFLPSTIYVNVNDTVEWVDTNPAEPHTVTFVGGVPGYEPANPMTLVGVSVPDPDADGDVQGTLPDAVTTSFLGVGGPVVCTVPLPCVNAFNSGFITPAAQEQTGTPQKTSVTRARITFTAPGTYNYFCALHDELGMVGKVIVGGGRDEDDDRK